MKQVIELTPGVLGGSMVSVTVEPFGAGLPPAGFCAMTVAFGRRLLKADLPGSAVLISSMSGEIVNVPQWAASYNASKAGVAHLAKSLSVEWAASGIRVNSIAPGYVLTDLTRQIIEREPELEADWISRIPLSRMATPEDLAGLVIFLASNASSYVTGQQIVIDGGYTAI